MNKYFYRSLMTVMAFSLMSCGSAGQTSDEAVDKQEEVPEETAETVNTVTEETSKEETSSTNKKENTYAEFNLNEIQNKDTLSAREELLTLSGVGPKVADCILLFSTLKRFDVFPIDVWVRRVMNELYIKNEDETKVSKNEISKIAKKKFGNLEGLAQQYLFYWKRES